MRNGIRLLIWFGKWTSSSLHWEDVFWNVSERSDLSNSSKSSNASTNVLRQTLLSKFLFCFRGDTSTHAIARILRSFLFGLGKWPSICQSLWNELLDGLQRSNLYYHPCMVLFERQRKYFFQRRDIEDLRKQKYQRLVSDCLRGVL